MRTAVATSHLSVTPGVPALCDIEVTNTSNIIDGVTVELTGLDPAWVQLTLPVVSLFPDATGVLTLRLLLPLECLAGEYLVNARVVSVIDPTRFTDHEFWVSVQPLELAWLELRPSVVTAGKKATYKAIVHNEGNVPLDFAVSTRDPARACTATVTPATSLVPARDTRSFDIKVRGPRPWFGQSATRELQVTAVSPEVQLEAKGTFTQKPRIARGVLTVLILAAIIALWAFLFLFVVQALRTKPAPTKSVPKSTQESLKAAQAAAAASGAPAAGAAAAPGAAAATTVAGAATGTTVAGAAPAAAAAPAGANPKVDLAVIGGALSGTVRATSTGAIVPRVVVEALRIGKNGPVPAGSAATGDDGTYKFPALLPGTYLVKFSGPGFQDVWYPAGTSQAAATPLSVTGPKQPVVADVVITGNPGSLKGTVLAPNAPAGTKITVQVLAPVAPAGAAGDTTASTAPAASTTAPAASTTAPAAGATTQAAAATTSLGIFPVGADGSFNATALPTPGTYTLHVEAAGYQPTDTDVTLAAGEDKIVNTITLGTKPGTITGIVVASNGTPLGNAVVTISAGPVTTAVNTPTTGKIGQFTFAALDTPKTYVVSAALEGYQSEARAVRLDPGASQQIQLTLVGGAGTVHGTVADASGKAIGGATVVVTNGTFTGSTTSLTTADAAGNGAGTYTVTGLPTPGVYAVTVTAPNFTSQTIEVSLDTAASVGNADVVLPAATATIDGTVTSAGAGAGQVSVALSDGVTPKVTATATKPAGKYTFADVAPGTYTLTFSRAGLVTKVELVTVAAADHLTKDIDLAVAPTTGGSPVAAGAAATSTTAANP